MQTKADIVGSDYIVFVENRHIVGYEWVNQVENRLPFTRETNNETNEWIIQKTF